jgi:hypothetical protein
MKYNNQKILARNKSAEIILAAYNTGKDEQEVLIKTVLPEEIDPIYDRLCYARELLHPGIQPVVEFGKCGRRSHTRHYVACKYSPGVSLTQLLRKLSFCKKNFPLPLVLHILNGISETVEYLHKQSPSTFIPHGNICTDNVYITFDGRILMVDSGFADLVRFRYDGISIIPNNFTIFSHADIKKGKRWKKRYEIYSLGLVLFCMLIGYNHFIGFYNQDDIHKLEFTSHFFPSIPSELNRIIARCIGNKTFGRNARYDDIEEFMSDLNDIKASFNIRYDQDLTAITVFALFFDSEQIPLQLRFLLWERMIDYCKRGTDNSIKLFLNNTIESLESTHYSRDISPEATIPEQIDIENTSKKIQSGITNQALNDFIVPPPLLMPDLPLPEHKEITESENPRGVTEKKLQPGSEKSVNAFSSLILGENTDLTRAEKHNNFFADSYQNNNKEFQSDQSDQYHISFSSIRLNKINQSIKEHPFSKILLKENLHT